MSNNKRQSLKSIETKISAMRIKQPVMIGKRITGRAWQRIRNYVLMRDNGLCVMCQDNKRITVACEVDHIVPLHLGGSNGMINLQSLCTECHKEKSNYENNGRK
jgi:5-methylcytosine-specific restriction endonuclease McrA